MTKCGTSISCIYIYIHVYHTCVGIDEHICNFSSGKSIHIYIYMYTMQHIVAHMAMYVCIYIYIHMYIHIYLHIFVVNYYLKTCVSCKPYSNRCLLLTHSSYITHVHIYTHMHVNSCVHTADSTHSNNMV